jgi:hypothetical protein
MVSFVNFVLSSLFGLSDVFLRRFIENLIVGIINGVNGRAGFRVLVKDVLSRVHLVIANELFAFP